MKPPIAAVAWLVACAVACARDFNPTLRQLNHRSFGRLDGAPTRVRALAQTADGMLWIASSAGLTRFDGSRFVGYPEPSDDPLPSSNISALLGAPDGGLWIGFLVGGVCFLNDGRVTCYKEIDDLGLGSVRRFALDADGSLLIATSGGLVGLRDRRAGRIAPEVIPKAVDVLVDRAGTAWVATGESIVARTKGDTKFHAVEKMPLPPSTFPQVLAEAPDGHVWAHANDLLTRLDPSAGEAGALPMRVTEQHAVNGRLLIDSGGNFWFPSHGGAVGRWSADNAVADTQSQERVVHEEFLPKADEFLNVILEDREHNIWMGVSTGLDRFSPSKVIRAAPPCPGLGYALAAGTAGELWAACGDPSHAAPSTLLQMRDGVVVAQRPSGEFTAAYRDRDGTIWFAAADQIASFDGHAFVSTALPQDLLQNEGIQALAKDGDGALWVSIVRRGIYRLLSGRWERGESLGLPPGPAIVETPDGDGGVWFGFPKNQIARLHGKTVQRFTAAEGLDVGNVTAIHRAGEQIWVGGEIGFSQLHGARFSPVRTARGTPIRGVSGIASTPNGDLWLNAIGGIVRISAPEIRRLAHDPVYPIQTEVFDGLDGVPGDPVGLRPLPSAMATSDGRVWFEMGGGLVWIDGTASMGNRIAPPVKLSALDSGERRYANRGESVDLPAGTSNVQFEYSAGSLMVPEHVSFRYRLVGLDRNWQEVGGRRRAYYTNLAPGKYTFQVLGSNNDGVWNETGASMDFTIAPALYQTTWFRGLSAAAVLGLILALYQLRLQQLQRQHEAQNQARLQFVHVERLAMLSAMTASITHEVSQPISGFLTNSHTCARMLASDPPNVTGATETIRRSIRDANRANEVVKRLRAMFAKQAPTIESVDLNDAAREVIAMALAELRQRGALLQTDFAESLPAISGDRVQLQQVILNLLLNAADAMVGIEDRPRTLRVQTERNGDTVTLTVRDVGVGLDPRGTEKLFEPFHTTKPHGLGIGLSISRSIIESHKGKLWARANDGPGATFGFSIPLSPAA